MQVRMSEAVVQSWSVGFFLHREEVVNPFHFCIIEISIEISSDFSMHFHGNLRIVSSFWGVPN